MTLNEYCTGIADAIREKEGSMGAIPAPDHAARIKAITTGVDTSADTVVADALTEGYTAHDAEGNLVNGANPYEKASTDSTVGAQANLIAQIQTALEGKVGGGVEMCEVTFTCNDNYVNIYYGVPDSAQAGFLHLEKPNSATLSLVKGGLIYITGNMAVGVADEGNVLGYNADSSSSAYVGTVLKSGAVTVGSGD